MIDIYYYHPLNLSFKSAQTIQVVRDYVNLSKLGYKIYLYGFYSNNGDLKEILDYISNSNIKIYYKKINFINKIVLKATFFARIIKNKNKKFLITRTLNKTIDLLKLKPLVKNSQILQEMHEEAFPHLIKNRANLKDKFINNIKKIDGVIFTNFSQQELFKIEFDYELKNSVVLPNGVELEKFSYAKRGNENILTYLGQFNKWKNVELIFEMLSLLDDKFTLRIAGGKNDEQSELFINDLIKKYNINKKRVNYLGFVKNEEVINKVLNGSSVLLLPLGNNVQSTHLTSPMKLFEYMATQIPVVAVDFPSVNMIVDEESIFLAPCDANSFKKAVINAIEDSKIDNRIKNMNQIANNYSYEKRSINYDAFLKKLEG